MASNKLDFFIESLKTIKKSGTITQSGPALCKVMTNHIQPDHKVIVEIGAGDGAITKYILKRMPKDAILLSFEINDTHHKKLLEIKDPRFHPILDSAEMIEKYLKIHGYNKADTIISSLPFRVLPTELTLTILSKCKRFLKDGGLFLQFHYSGKLKKLYKATFHEVSTQFVLLNAPPAIVFSCKKKAI